MDDAAVVKEEWHMEHYEKLTKRQAKLAVVGLGYVGLPLAAAFSHHFSVLGFDVNQAKIEAYRQGRDATQELGDQALAQCGVEFTWEEDLTPVIRASQTVGRNLRPGAIVVYESTVYPGVTEDICAPILERESGMVCGKDFYLGYSPERINPGDKAHPLKSIRKIVSGMDRATLEQIKAVYDSIIEAGTYPVSTIKTAEAIKVVENSQRDINIAFMNEMAMVFERMQIDTNEVVDGMNTKWNALGFRPGLVGGHCIGVDPYYFVYQAERLGYHSQIVASGRRVNDDMGRFVAEKTIKLMVRAGIDPSRANIVILGITFKENCPDIRNSKVMDIVEQLGEYGITPKVVDPWADPAEVRAAYGVQLTPLEQAAGEADCILHAVAHREFQALGLKGVLALYRPAKDAKRVLVDVKGQWPVEDLEKTGLSWWRL